MCHNSGRLSSLSLADKANPIGRTDASVKIAGQSGITRALDETSRDWTRVKHTDSGIEFFFQQSCPDDGLRRIIKIRR